jgi:hypothetical protein
MAIDPTTPTTIYAGLVEDSGHPNWGVIKSVDGGNNWTPLNAGPLADSGVFALVIDPTTPSTLYAGLSGTGNDFVTVGGGVFKSYDGGNNWTQLNAGPLANSGVMALLMDPLTPSTLYAGSDPASNLGKLYKTSDGGTTWVDTGFPTLSGSPLNVRSLAMLLNPVTLSETIYVGTDAGGIYVSSDNGVTWSAFGTGLPNLGVSVLAIDAMTLSTMYAGMDGWVYTGTDEDGWTEVGAVFKSIDGGVTWNEFDSLLPINTPVHTLAINPMNTSVLYVGFWGGGAFTSVDGGQDWTDFNAGLSDPYVHSIVPNPVTPGVMYAGTCNAGVFVLQPSSSDQ